MCLYAVKQVSAQTAEPAATAVAEIKPLQIGDTIPEYLWHLSLQVVNHPEGRDTVTLDEYRGKLIILDFWATWCGSCVETMPQANELLNKNRDKLCILPISTETIDKVSAFWYANQITKSLTLSPIIGNQVLQEAFPHRSVPHLVWISPTGVVNAYTSSRQLNGGKLLSALNGDFTGVRQKINVDVTKPLFISGSLPSSNLRQLSLLFRGRLEGLASGNVFRRVDGTIHGRMLSNKTLLTLFEVCARELIIDYDRKRLRCETKEAGGLSPEFSNLHLEQWRDSLFYTIEVVLAVEQRHRLYSEMLETLNRNTPYIASIEPMMTDCYVLREANAEKRATAVAKGKGANPMFIQAMNKLSWNECPFVDETTKEKRFNEDMFANIDDRESLREMLLSHGLSLVSDQRELDILVIRDDTAN